MSLVGNTASALYGGNMPSMPRFPAEEVEQALGVGRAELLGCGAFGDTWRVDDTAVKIIVEDGYPPARVVREVSGLTRVDSPHVVQLLSTRVVSLGGQDRPTLVFEYVSGGDLQSRVAAGNRPTADEAVALLRGLLVGVRALHGSGTVHRDIKPGNIALRDGRWAAPVLLDLGLARNLTDSTITAHGAAVGTASYMAPEQLRAQRVRKAADLFGVGVTVRQVLTGRHPFYNVGVAYTMDEALRRIEAGPLPLSVGTDVGLVALLDRLTSYAEHDRGSAASALRRLERVTQ
jgi:serine/threonine protein kinase